MAPSLPLTFIGLTLLLYILRGIGWLTFLPGGVILLCAALSILMSVAYSLANKRRL